MPQESLKTVGFHTQDTYLDRFPSKTIVALQILHNFLIHEFTEECEMLPDYSINGHTVFHVRIIQ